MSKPSARDRLLEQIRDRLQTSSHRTAFRAGHDLDALLPAFQRLTEE